MEWLRRKFVYRIKKWWRQFSVRHRIYTKPRAQMKGIGANDGNVLRRFQEWCKRKKNFVFSENTHALLRRIVIYGVIIAVSYIDFYIVDTGVQLSLPKALLYVYVFISMGVFFSFGLFGLMFLVEGLKHPKLYVNAYTFICLLWECFSILICVVFLDMYWVNVMLFTMTVTPLIPIWYWSYKRYKKEERAS